MIMVSVEQWKNHFKQLAHRSFPDEDMYIVNQRGRGIGRNAYRKTTYKIRKNAPSGAGSPKAPVTIVSPVAQTVNRARALTGKKPIKGRCSRPTPSRSKSRRGKRGPRKKKSRRRKKKASPGKRSTACPCPSRIHLKGKYACHPARAARRKVTKKKKKNPSPRRRKK